MGSVFAVEGTDAAGHIDDVVPVAIAQLARGALGSKDEVLAEIDAMTDAIRDFWAQAPDRVMVACAAYSARATEMSVLLHRIEGVDRNFRQVRTLEVRPLIEELERQFRVASRLIEMRRQDIETSRGFA